MTEKRHHWVLPGPAILFCPATRSERFTRAAAAADLVVIDLEDAVAPSDKAEARAAVVHAFARGTLDPATTIVRVNGLDTSWGREDVVALRSADARTIMVPKAEGHLFDARLDGLDVVALCETADGVLTAREVASSPSCIAIAWGGQDLAAQVGAPPLEEDGGLHVTALHARMVIRYAAAGAGIPAIDTVRTNVADVSGLRVEARDAAEMGFVGKLIIHPSQVAIVRAAFRPTVAELAWARRVQRAIRVQGRGVVLVDGVMVDAPVVARAQALIERSQQ